MFKLKESFVLFACLCSSFAAMAQDLKVEKYHLANGLTVILHENHSLPTVAVNIWYKVGSKDEVARRTGFAHLFEHLMFMGTERVPTGQFDAIMEGGGGANNASTSEDRTNYYDLGPAALLPTLLWLEADRMEALGKNMNQKKLDLQREVVKNERRQSYENQPYGKAYLAINPLIYPEGHPYHIPVIGLTEDLDAATVKDVQDFFANYYVPNNASLVVAGDFDSKAVKPLIDQLFGTLPRQNDPVHRQAPPATLTTVKRVTIVDEGVSQPKLMMVWLSPASYTQGDIDMNLTGSVLGDGVAGRLYQRLVNEKNLATEVSASQNSLLLGSQFMVEITGKPGSDLDLLERETEAVLKDYLKRGPSSEELRRQTAKVENGLLSGLESLEGRADRLNESEYYFGEPNSLKHILAMYDSAKPSEVRDVARDVIKMDARLVMRVIPQPVVAQGDPRSKRPEAFVENPFKLPVPVQFKLANGIPVYFWRRPELPLMNLVLVEKGGAYSDPVGKAGASAISAEMLSQGTGALTAEGFENSLSVLGANFSAYSGRLRSGASVSVLAPNFDKALGLFADALIRPKFEKADWDRTQATTVAELQRAAEDPTTIAKNLAAAELFGEGTPYGTPVAGDPASVKSLGLDDAKGRYTSIFRPEQATIFIAGSLDQDSVQASLEKSLGGWKTSGAATVTVPTVTYVSAHGLRVFLVNKPKAVQTVVRFLMPAPKYSDPNREKLVALSTIFGGTFTSRLNHNLREDKGYTYGAFSNYTLDPVMGTFSAASSVRADVTGPALKEFLAEITKVRGGDVTDEEASKARSTLHSETVQSLQGLSGLIGNAVALYSNDLPFEALNDDLVTVSKITAADLNALAKDAIPMEKGVLVLVGDKELILKQIEGLGLPKPTIIG